MGEWTANPRRPPSPKALTRTRAAGVRRSRPARVSSRTRPGRSVTSAGPLGRKASSQGTSSPAATFSTRGSADAGVAAAATMAATGVAVTGRERLIIGDLSSRTRPCSLADEQLWRLIAGADDHGRPLRRGLDGIDARERGAVVVGLAEQVVALGLVAGLAGAGARAPDPGVLGLRGVHRGLDVIRERDVDQAEPEALEELRAERVRDVGGERLVDVVLDRLDRRVRVAAGAARADQRAGRDEVGARIVTDLAPQVVDEHGPDHGVGHRREAVVALPRIERAEAPGAHGEIEAAQQLGVGLAHEAEIGDALDARLD